MTLAARITAHKGILICQTLAKKSEPDRCHLSIDNPDVIGQVFMNSKMNVGISKKALELLKTIRLGRDSIGDIDWFKAGDMHCFGWLGPINRLVDPAQVETSRQFVIGEYVEIENEVPVEAEMAIDAGAR